MRDNAIICNKLSNLLKYYEELKSFSDISFKEYTDNIILKRAIERQLQLIIECATDINNMILKQHFHLPSKDYFSSFIDLAENDIIPMDFALQIAPSTGLRNILVHEYQKIDDNIVFKSIGKVFMYYSKYIKIIYDYLGCV